MMVVRRGNVRTTSQPSLGEHMERPRQTPGSTVIRGVRPTWAGPSRPGLQPVDSLDSPLSISRNFGLSLWYFDEVHNPSLYGYIFLLTFV